MTHPAPPTSHKVTVDTAFKNLTLALHDRTGAVIQINQTFIDAEASKEEK
ncbi:hypothetical protein H6F86_02890 [Phormidium sp. FACHB-592]|uniref:Uncharacterized protein n=1 Tax=Stenomitos frigidus AS-A4 TaxID=2933935 RepID=A0ABV0KR03_9CYAN|nr:hypothetical protein [Phormidium sp. FACHB-592]MBD2072851.1 hypothetical protein [Phormidium sp. FACHB-592]